MFDEAVQVVVSTVMLAKVNFTRDFLHLARNVLILFLSLHDALLVLLEQS